MPNDTLKLPPFLKRLEEPTTPADWNDYPWPHPSQSPRGLRMANITSLHLIWYEIENGTQRSVALMYAASFKAFDASPDTLRSVNAAIVERWSRRGLERVKSMAWKIWHDVIEATEPSVSSEGLKE